MRFTAPPTAYSFDKVFTMEWQPVFWNFAYNYWVYFLIALVTSFIIWICLSSKLWNKKKFFVRTLVVLNMCICVLSGVVVFAVVLEKIKALVI